MRGARVLTCCIPHMGQAACAARDAALRDEEALTRALKACIPGFEHPASQHAAWGGEPDDDDSKHAISFDALLAACAKRLKKRQRKQGQLQRKQAIKAGKGSPQVEEASSGGGSGSSDGSSSSSSCSSSAEDAALSRPAVTRCGGWPRASRRVLQ